MMLIVGAVVAVLMIALLGYISTRYYEGRHDRTYMTQDERGFRRALKGKTVLWDVEESIVKGPDAPRHRVRRARSGHGRAAHGAIARSPRPAR